MLGEHPGWIDRDEEAPALSQYLTFFIKDARHIHVLASTYRPLSSFSYQTLAQRHQLQKFHLHGLGNGDNRPQLVHLAHGLIEDGGNNASVRVSRRPLKAQRQPKAAPGSAARVIEPELHAHALGIVWTASETMVLGDARVFGIVPGSAGFGHRM